MRATIWVCGGTLNGADSPTPMHEKSVRIDATVMRSRAPSISAVTTGP